MSKPNADLHGNAPPDKSGVALLLIDLINDLEFDGGDQLLVQVRPIVSRIAALKRRSQMPANPRDLRQRQFRPLAVRLQRSGRPLPERRCPRAVPRRALHPDEDDYFVLKPKHSGFFSTTLDILLDYLQAKTLILTGIAGNNCVLFTANDAYMRDFSPFRPERLHRVELRGGQPYCSRADARRTEGRRPPSTALDLESLVREASSVKSQDRRPPIEGRH